MTEENKENLEKNSKPLSSNTKAEGTIVKDLDNKNIKMADTPKKKELSNDSKDGDKSEKFDEAKQKT